MVSLPNFLLQLFRGKLERSVSMFILAVKRRRDGVCINKEGKRGGKSSYIRPLWITARDS
ncbi:unnamed protein product [Boreogadus saida]